MELFKLFGTIAINNTDANIAIDESANKASSFGEKLSSGISTAARWGTAIVGGAVAATTGLVKFAETSASTADNIDKMSQKIGISREAYQELDFICSQAGTSVDQLQTGMKTLTNQMQAASDGTASAVSMFEQLGVSVTDTEGNMRSQEDVMFDVIDSLQKMENQTVKAGLANDLFGKMGSELMPLLNEEAGSMAEMKQQAHELGLVLSDDIIDNGVELTDSIDQTKRAFGAIITQLGGALMPIVTQVSNGLQEALPTIQAMFSSLAPVLSTLFAGLLPPLAELAKSIFPVLISLIETIMPPLVEFANAIIPVIVDLISMLLPPIIEIVNMVLPLLVKLLEPLLSVLSPILDLISPLLNLVVLLLEPLIKLLDLILPPLITIIGDIVAVLSDKLGKAINFVADLLQNSLGKAFENIQIVVDTMKNVFATFIDFFKNVFAGNWSAAWDNIKNIFTSVWEGIQKVFKNYVNWIIGGVEILINGVIHSINGMLSGIGKVVSAVGDLLGLEWNMPSLSDVSLPRLAKGGILEQGQIGLLEGDGAEAVVPLERNREWIARVSEEMNVQGIGGDKETLNVLREILAYMADIKESNSELPDAISDAISNMKFSINRREFARLVKAV